MEKIEKFNVIWNTPGSGSPDSMPAGNGDIGVNVWTEENGDLLFYISKTDTWNENMRLLKIGRMRVSFKPGLNVKNMSFSQKLDFCQGSISICTGQPEMEIVIWVDANRPVIHLDIRGSNPFETEAVLEVWRTSERRLEGQELHSSYAMCDSPEPVIELPDVVVENQDDRVIWYHRNEASIWDATMRLQGLQDIEGRYDDPLLHLTFGCAVKGTGLANIDSGTLRTIKPLKECHISLYPLTMRADTIQAWTEALEKNIVRMESSDLDIARGEHKKWWKHFWDKSYIYISGGREAEAVTQGYIFQRYMNACAGRGGYPIKFNGSIFTMDTVEKIADTKYGADYRRWGGPYWFQNTRLIYWPMLSSGDFEMMRPLFRMYLDALPLAKYRTERYYGHSGAFFPETMCFWGTYANKDYGWDREGIPDGFVQNPYIRYYWSGAIELCVMMVEYYRYTQDMDFAQDSLLPMAEAVIEFYDKHFDRGADGKIVFYPAMALETWHDVKNPAPEIAGLGYILRMLLALPRELAGKVRQQRWIRLQNEIPSIPQGEKNGKECLLPAEKLVQTIRQNWENPELYSVFPYKLYGAGREGMQKALDTFDMRDIRDNGCWHQDAIHAACLGLIEESKKMVVQSFSAWCKECRFPGFWGPGSDWVPDMDHGGAASTALQAMLLQVDGDRMLLLPAWPREWDVECRMYGPCNTIIKLRLRDGFIEELDIEPRENRKNVSIINFTTA